MQIGQCVVYLVDGLAHAQNEIAFGDQPEITGGGDHLEAALVPEGRTDPLEYPRDGFEVVREHFWTRIKNLAQQFRHPVEVGGE